MKEFTYEEKIAVMRVILDIVMADGKVDERERTFFTEIASSLHLGQEAKDDVDRCNSLLALTVIHDLDDQQKEQVAKLMGKMIIVDEDINYNEVKIYNVVNEFCQINIDFDENDYPQYSRS